MQVDSFLLHSSLRDRPPRSSVQPWITSGVTMLSNLPYPSLGYWIISLDSGSLDLTVASELYVVPLFPGNWLSQRLAISLIPRLSRTSASTQERLEQVGSTSAGSRFKPLHPKHLVFISSLATAQGPTSFTASNCKTLATFGNYSHLHVPNCNSANFPSPSWMAARPRLLPLDSWNSCTILWQSSVTVLYWSAIKRLLHRPVLSLWSEQSPPFPSLFITESQTQPGCSWP